MEKVLAAIEKGNDWLNGIVWGVPMLALLIGAGLFLTVLLKGIQFRKFGYAMKNTVGRAFKKQQAGKGAITPFQAMTTALAATVGTGNIAGITAAVTMGGPGVIFWLWVSALVGMATKFSEIVLAVKYRERNDSGDWVGGPMYYIKNGMGKNWGWLASAFCVFGVLASFGIGNAVQVGNITSSVGNVITEFCHVNEKTNSTINLIIGLVTALIVGAVMFGGIKRLGAVTEKLIPVMSLLYIFCCLAVIFKNYGKLGAVFSMIIKGAFTPGGMTGGAAAVTLKSCVTWGLKRGIFSNEAGLGSAPIAHASTSERDPVMQGLFGIFEVFADSIVICTLTGVTLLTSGVELNYGVQGATALNALAFGTVFGDKLSALLIALVLSLFALSTMLSWGLYGSRCIEAIFGTEAVNAYRIVFVAVTVVGAVIKLDLAWNIADTLNGLMAIPNLVALMGLSGVVAKATGEHFGKYGKKSKRSVRAL